MTEYVVVYERAENGDWGAYLPDLPGVVAGGDTQEEVAELIKECVAAFFDYAREQGHDQLPAPVSRTGVVHVEVPA